MKKLKLSGFLAFSLSLALFMNGCAPASTPISVKPLPTDISQPATTLETDIPLPTDAPLTTAEVEKLAGFDVKEPAYLPPGVSLDSASYQDSPTPIAILHFKLIHETFGDMGAFFQIMQEPQAVAPPDTTSCGTAVEGCEILPIGDTQVVYRLNPGGTEGLDWYADGFSFHLLRTAGEPGKVYKEDLVSVVESMK